MTSYNRHSRRARDDVSSNFKGSEPDGLRRSTRERLGQKGSAESLTIRKSDRIETRSPTKPPGDGGAEKKGVGPSPLRRSDRGKGLSASVASLELKISGKSSPAKQDKGQKEKSMTQRSLESKEVGRSGKDKVTPIEPGSKRLTVRDYKALYKNRKLKSPGHSNTKEREGKLLQGDGNNSEGELDGVDESSSSGAVTLEGQNVREASERNLVVKELVKDKNGGKEVPSSSGSPNAIKKIKNVQPETVPVNSSENQKEKENEAEPVDSLTGGGTSEESVLGSGQETLPSKRKKIMGDTDADCPEANASKRVCTSNGEAAASLLPSEGSPVLNSDAPSIRLSVELDSTREGISTRSSNLNPELASPSLNKDTEKLEAHTTVGLAEKCTSLLQQKGHPKSLPLVSEQFRCFTCKLGGTLLCCVGSGCKRCYHFSCLDPPMDEVPVGDWYCLACVKKKLECGVHSVSEGVESILDTKEVSVLDVDGLQNGREFFVKYMRLAHVHNRWIPESKLLHDAPALISKFGRKSQVISWKQEWTIPHRLLQKRLLMSPKQRDLYVTEHVGIKLDSHYEWLVKWRGLGYEDLTWELDNASFFNSPDGQGLIKDYENRHKRTSSTVDKIHVSENSKSDKLSELRPGTSPGSDRNFQDFTDKLREFWRKDQNAVVVEELANERFRKAISLVQSFQPNNCGPFLIVSSSATLHSWDNEFLKSAPHLNVVVYNGNKDLRKLIRKLEFYAEGGLIMFQVLVTTFEIVREDLDILKRLKWELFIIDEPQRSKISTHYPQIKQLDARRRLLLLSCQLKENVAEYNNLLCLLESPKDSPNFNSLLTGSGDSVVNLKERLSRYIVHQHKLDFSRFREYWVPLRMANLQLEQYCATMISNSALLSAPNKITSAGSLRDVLVSSRKCCDHPYIVDTTTPDRLSKGIPQSEYLNFGINASGKFQFLDLMLSEMKKKGLRALILFQDFGKDSIGGFLDDLLRQRFGSDSYDSILAGIPRTTKIAAMTKFNEDSSRFVFLLETRACNSSIKLSSINTVIIFGSDWNPMNDVRSLQKLTLDPPSEQIPIFRLYVSHTLEEKALSLAVKQERNIDSLQNIGWNTSHLLLTWGASHQFRSLEEFHRDTIMDSRANPSMEDAVLEIIQIISSKCKDTESRSSSIVSSVQIIGGAYRSESSLPGELQCKVMDEGEPHLFWAKLLEGKHPQWKFISGSTQRNRKKVQYFEKEAASEEAVKKRRRLLNSVDSPSSELESVGVSTPRLTTPHFREGNESICANSATAPASPLDKNILEVLQNENFETEERRKLREAQKSLHLSMKPGIVQLCKILHITGESEGFVNEFLEYMMTYHNVSSDSPTMKQAFQISLIWTVASLLDLKIDHQQSVELARQHLSFNCRKFEVDFAYSMLRCFKTVFAYRTGKLEAVSLSSRGLSSYTRGDVMHCVNQIQKKCQKKLQKLVQKQEKEKEKIMQRYEEDKSRIEDRLKMKSMVIRACCEENTSMRQDKLRSAEISCAEELEELENKKNTSIKNLESEELASRKTLQEKKAGWLGAVKSWVCPELFGKKLENEPFSLSELLQTNEGSLNNLVENPDSVNPLSHEDQTCNGLTANVPEKVVQMGVPKMMLSRDGVQELVSRHRPSLEDGGHTIAPSVPVDKIQPNIPANEVQSEVQQKLAPTDGVQNLVSGYEPSSEDQDPDTISATMPVNEMQPEAVHSGDGVVNGCSSSLFPSEEQIPDTAMTNAPNGEVPSSIPEPSHHEVEANHTGEVNSEIPTAASSGSISLAGQKSPSNAVDQDSALQELCQTNFSGVPPETELNNGNPVPPNQASQGECNPLSTPVGTQLEDTSAGGQQNASEVVELPLSRPVNSAEPNERVSEATVSELALEVGVSPSSDPLSRDKSAGVPLGEETPRIEIHASNQVSKSPAQLSANTPPVSNPPILLPRTSSSGSPNGFPVGPSGLHFSGSRAMTIAPEFHNHSAQPVLSWISPPPFIDPLQKELERLSAEIEGFRKSHEDTTLKLKSDREKEIEEINRKYELKHQEVDANFQSKKNQFEYRHNKVLLNKILAEAFRTKCMEVRTSNRSGTQQDVNGNSGHQIVHQPIQQTPPRPPLVVGPSSTVPPTPRLQTRTPEPNLRATPTPVSATAARNTPPPPSTQTAAPRNAPPPLPAIATRNPPLPVQAVVRPTTASSRPPQVSSISYSTASPQGGAQMTSRPPHLRSSSSVVGLPPPRAANSVSSPASTAPPPPPPPPQLPASTRQPDPVGPAHRETSRDLPNISNLAAVQEEAHRNQPSRVQSVSLPSVVDWQIAAEQVSAAVFGSAGARINRGTTSEPPADVVCLSDDD